MTETVFECEGPTAEEVETAFGRVVGATMATDSVVRGVPLSLFSMLDRPESCGSMYVRPCYEALAQRLVDYMVSSGGNNSEDKGDKEHQEARDLSLIVRGTPGVGKSVFAVYFVNYVVAHEAELLARLRAAHPGRECTGVALTLHASLAHAAAHVPQAHWRVWREGARWRAARCAARAQHRAGVYTLNVYDTLPLACACPRAAACTLLVTGMQRGHYEALPALSTCVTSTMPLWDGAEARRAETLLPLPARLIGVRVADTPGAEAALHVLHACSGGGETSGDATTTTTTPTTTTMTTTTRMESRGDKWWELVGTCTWEQLFGWNPRFLFGGTEGACTWLTEILDEIDSVDKRYLELMMEHSINFENVARNFWGAIVVGGAAAELDYPSRVVQQLCEERLFPHHLEYAYFRLKEQSGAKQAIAFRDLCHHITASGPLLTPRDCCRALPLTQLDGALVAQRPVFADLALPAAGRPRARFAARDLERGAWALPTAPGHYRPEHAFDCAHFDGFAFDGTTLSFFKSTVGDIHGVALPPTTGAVIDTLFDRFGATSARFLWLVLPEHFPAPTTPVARVTVPGDRLFSTVAQYIVQISPHIVAEANLP